MTTSKNRRRSSKSAGAIGGTVSVRCAFDAMVPLEEVRPYPRNPVRHPQKQIELLAGIIQRTGWRNPIVISNRSGYVVKGHGRLMAARMLGVAEVPVDYQDYATDAEEKADRIADNKIAELAEDDLDALVAEMEDLKLEEFDLGELGMDGPELDELIAKMGGGVIPEGNKPIDEGEMENTKHECPKCGFKW